MSFSKDKVNKTQECKIGITVRGWKKRTKNTQSVIAVGHMPMFTTFNCNYIKSCVTKLQEFRPKACIILRERQSERENVAHVILRTENALQIRKSNNSI